MLKDFGSGLEEIISKSSLNIEISLKIYAAINQRYKEKMLSKRMPITDVFNIKAAQIVNILAAAKQK
jgi:hypothetical protein